MKAVFLDQDTFSIPLQKPTALEKMVSHARTAQDDELIISRCQDADIIITNKVIINANIINRLPKLKLIHITATGINNVDLKACHEHGIVVKNVAGYSAQSVAEHTLMFMLTAMRAGKHYHTQATDGTWQADGKFCLLDTPILDLAGRTLGIIGKGAIGSQVGQMATAFGMNVLYAERQGKAVRNGYTAFDDVLKRADVLSLHCPLTDETHHLINKNTLAKLGKKPLIINVARGGVVDGSAIVQALNDGQILGYCTDVFEQEPPQDNESLLTLKNHPRVFFTPHNAWASVQAQTRLWAILCEQVNDFVKETAQT